MNFVYAFMLAGIVCAIGEVLLSFTKMTPGHITSLFTVFGAVLSFFGIYEKLIEYCGAGATLLISNFGHSLYTASLEGYYESGILGIFSNMLSKSSLAIVGAIVIAFLISMVFKPKN